MGDHQEIVLKANHTIGVVKLSAAFNYSPNYFGRSGSGFYLEGGADLSLPWDFIGFGRLGHQWIERTPRYGTPDYLWYGIGVQREVAFGITAALAGTARISAGATANRPPPARIKASAPAEGGSCSPSPGTSERPVGAGPNGPEP